MLATRIIAELEAEDDAELAHDTLDQRPDPALPGGTRRLLTRPEGAAGAADDPLGVPP